MSFPRGMGLLLLARTPGGLDKRDNFILKLFRNLRVYTLSVGTEMFALESAPLFMQ
jgi:hypothetical protein